MTWPAEIWLTRVNGTLEAHTSEDDARRHVQPWAEQDILRVETGRGSPCVACGGNVTYPERADRQYEPEVISPEVARLGGGSCG
jgi:hypothetical protein